MGSTRIGPPRKRKRNNKKKRRQQHNHGVTVKVNNKKNTTLLNIGQRLEIYWPDDERYYKGTIASKRQQSDGHYHVEYDDGDDEYVDLAKEEYRLIQENTTKNNKANHQVKAENDEKVQVGQRIEIYWPREKHYYKGTLISSSHDDGDNNCFHIVYDDGDEESIDLSQEVYRILSGGSGSSGCGAEEEEEEEEEEAKAGPDSSNINSSVPADVIIPPKIGSRVSVWWEIYGEYFDGTVTRIRGIGDGGNNKKPHYVVYDDGEERWECLDPQRRKFKLLSTGEDNDDNDNGGDDEQEDNNSKKQKEKNGDGKSTKDKKVRRNIDDDEEEGIVASSSIHKKKKKRLSASSSRRSSSRGNNDDGIEKKEDQQATTIVTSKSKRRRRTTDSVEEKEEKNAVPTKKRRLRRISSITIEGDNDDEEEEEEEKEEEGNITAYTKKANTAATTSRYTKNPTIISAIISPDHGGPEDETSSNNSTLEQLTSSPSRDYSRAGEQHQQKQQQQKQDTGVAKALWNERCPLCTADEMNHPTSLDCCHLFCKACIKKELRRNKSNQCPVCEYPLVQGGKKIHLHNSMKFPDAFRAVQMIDVSTYQVMQTFTSASAASIQLAGDHPCPTSARFSAQKIVDACRSKTKKEKDYRGSLWMFQDEASSPTNKRASRADKFKGIKFQEDTSEQASHADDGSTSKFRGIAIEQVNLNDGKVIQVFTSINKATESTGISRAQICRVLERRGDPDAGGFFWRYQGEKHNAPTAPSSSSDRRGEADCTNKSASEKVEQLCIETGEVLATYSSADEAMKAMGMISTRCIRNVCNGRQQTSKGFFWRWAGSDALPPKTPPPPPPQVRKESSNKKVIKVRNSEKGPVIKEFDNLDDVAEWMGVTSSSFCSWTSCSENGSITKKRQCYWSYN